MLISEIAKIVIFEVNLDHHQKHPPINMDKLLFFVFVHVILPGSTRINTSEQCSKAEMSSLCSKGQLATGHLKINQSTGSPSCADGRHPS